MIKNFEEITAKLNEEDLVIVKHLSQSFNNMSKGKGSAITSTTIKNVFKTKLNINLNDVKLRKMIQHIRLNNLSPNLCSSSSGYYIAENKKELLDTLQSLADRINTQVATYNALKAQYEKFDSNNSKLF